MQMYVWCSHALGEYTPGVICAIGKNVDEARLNALTKFDQEISNLSCQRETFINDLAATPIETNAFLIQGSA